MATPSDNDWRTLTTVIYKKPRDSKIFGSVEFDVTAVEEFISAKRREGLKITLTHIFMLALARGIRAEAPEINSYVRRGKIIHRTSVDVSLTVLLGPSKQLTSVKIDGAENLNLQELSAIVQTGVKDARTGRQAGATKAKNLVVRIPWPFRQWIADLLRWLTIDLGIPLPFLGVSPESFGSFVLTNLGSIGLDVGYPALAPFSNVAMVVSQGGVSEKPVVVDGQIVVRRMITISAALDHRVVDAGQAGRLFTYLRKVIKHPEMLETKPVYTG